MSVREMRQLLPAVAMQEGAGVTIRRTIGTPALRHLDPFLMLDQFGSDNPNELNVLAAINVLSEEDYGDLVTVQDGDSHVRIWIDSKSSIE